MKSTSGSKNFKFYKCPMFFYVLSEKNDFLIDKKGAFRRNKINSKDTRVSLASVYTSGEINEQVNLQDFITNHIKKISSKHYYAIGQDRNA